MLGDAKERLAVAELEMTWLTGARLSAHELDLLTLIGYLLMKWNYAEWAARLILRREVIDDPNEDSSLNNTAHLTLSGRTAGWIESRLRDKTLPSWQEPGRAYLEHLVLAYSIAREHRNKIVHGIWGIMDASGPNPAKALLINVKPIAGKSPRPELLTTADIQPLSDYFTELAEFAQNVAVGFTTSGERERNQDGSVALEKLPPLINLLDRCTYKITY